MRGLLRGPLGESPPGCNSFSALQKCNLLYLDDAGSPGNPTEDYFVLGGIWVFEAQVEWFSRELDKLATPFDKNPEDVEFHASTIFSRRGASWKSLQIDERAAFSNPF